LGITAAGAWSALAHTLVVGRCLSLENAVSVPIFGTRAIWLPKILLVTLVVCLIFAAQGS
jgi:hypothetical protein